MSNKIVQQLIWIGLLFTPIALVGCGSKSAPVVVPPPVAPVPTVPELDPEIPSIETGRLTGSQTHQEIDKLKQVRSALLSFSQAVERFTDLNLLRAREALKEPFLRFLLLHGDETIGRGRSQNKPEITRLTLETIFLRALILHYQGHWDRSQATLEVIEEELNEISVASVASSSTRIRVSMCGQRLSLESAMGALSTLNEGKQVPEGPCSEQSILQEDTLPMGFVAKSESVESSDIKEGTEK